MSVDPKHPWDIKPTKKVDPLAGSCTFAGQTLPDELPADPMPLFREWLQLAADQGVLPNPNAMSLATVNAEGQPSARIVLARRFYPDKGCLVFFTNYDSHKGSDLEQNPKVAACFHWDTLDRQVRIEGIVTKSPDSESVEYFNQRPLMSRVAAWASTQSAPIASRQQLLAQNDAVEKRFNVVGGDEAVAKLTPEQIKQFTVPRPPHWGGYRLWIARIELWLGHSTRLHDRARWQCTLTPATIDNVPGYTPGPWSVTRLQP